MPAEEASLTRLYAKVVELEPWPAVGSFLDESPRHLAAGGVWQSTGPTSLGTQ
jgi:hypothetical protein